MLKKIKSFFSSLFINWKAEDNLIKQCNRMTPLHRKVSNSISCIFLVIAIIVWLCSFPSSADEEITPPILPPGVPTDLTGYTVTVPENWFTAFGYGIFNLECEVLGDIGGDNSVYSSITNIYIGYQFTEWDPIAISNVLSLVSDYGDYFVLMNQSDNLQFTITGGSDASNSFLIQWFVDNNATFVPSESEPDPNPLVTFNKGLYRVNYFWYQSPISTQLDGMEFYSLNEGDLYTSINVQNDQLIFDEDNGDMHVMASYTTTGAKWVDNSGQFVYFINDESIPQSLAEQIPTLLEYIPDVSLTEFQRMQDSWYYGVLDGYSGGYTQATNDTQGTFLGNIFGGVFDALDKFQMFGQFSFLDFIKSIIGILALIWFLKLLAGG